MMYTFYILIFFVFSTEIFSDQYINNCIIKSSDYIVIENVDYQPTNSILMLQQSTVTSKEMCAFECLNNVLCSTATFKINIDQCTLYFERMINSQLIPFIHGYVLSVRSTLSSLSKLTSLLSPSDSIFSIWNSGIGRSSSPSSPGFGIGQYPSSQSASVAIDQLRNTTYVNYGNSSRWVNSTLGGVGSGFYVLTNFGVPSVLIQFRLATGSGYPVRDPLVISIEGSNGGNLTQGSSWTLVYNGSTGLEIDPGRQTFGPYQFVFNTKAYSYYRFLVEQLRSPIDCVQYSEVEFYGYLINLY